MSTLIHVLAWFNLVLYTVVALVALRQWRLGRGPAALWAALTFGALAVVVDVGRLLPENPETFLEHAGLRAIIVGLVLFPYFLFRFASAFERYEGRLVRWLGYVTGAMVVWTLVLPSIPAEGEPWPPWFVAYIIAFTLHWTALATAVAFRLWRARRGQPAVARRRMQLLSAASLGITAALVLAATGPANGGVADLVVSILATLSAVTFLLGIAPPALLRLAWRRPETARSQEVIARLMSATTETDIAREVLPAIAGLAGARRAALYAEDGRRIGSFGPEDEAPTAQTTRLEIPSGVLEVEPSPYAPYFGTDELAMLRTLGALTGLALDRARLFGYEREARETLERADDLKSSFIALAAHELRTPVSTIDGIVQTLHLRAGQLDPMDVTALEAALRQQTSSLGTLVEQLLDLSRLDAEAVPIEPRAFPVRGRVEALVATTGQSDGLRIDVDESLVAVADERVFDRIVTNLVTNALRYGAPPVIVTADQRDHHFRLSVEDRGPGVPAEFVPSLFERFTRSEGTRDRASGTGLGLAIARSYAQAHGGELLYHAAQPTGARFELVLPNGN